MKSATLSLVVAAALLATAGMARAQVQVDPAIGVYKPVQGISGNLKSIGSDTMNNEMTLWAEGFLGMYPNVQIEIEGKGSTTAPAALIAGTAHFGPMSREMKSAEIDAFEKRYGYKPTALPTSIDMLAVYAHKDNPIKATPANAYTGEYPLARFLYVYVNHKPGTELDPLRREFVRYIYSQQGQQDVVKDGYYPLPAPICREALQSLGIEPGF